MSSKGLFRIFLLVMCGCGALHAQDKQDYALKGTLATPSDVIPGGTVVVRGERIDAVGLEVNLAPNVKAIETDSFIFPGLIDLHNHLTWNLFPRWQPKVKVSNRYEWQQRNDYKAALDTPHRLLFEENWRCEMNFYGEVKAIVGGATSSVGSLGPSAKGLTDNRCIEGLARNLDFYSGFYQPGVVNGEKLRYEVFPLELSFDEADSIRKDLASGQLKAFVIHIAEGKPGDASAAREYRMIKAQGFLVPGASFIHGVALAPAQLREMASKGVGLIWSPRSNIELYDGTTDVAAAKRAGVTIALSPDWSPSGSSGMLEELKYAAAWNARQNPKVFDEAELVKMATVYPAQLVGLSDKLGSLARGRFADLLLLKRKGNEPYGALLHASPLDVRLVIIGGTPVYGDRDLMEKLLPPDQLESVKVCGKENEKFVYLGSQASLGGALRKTWKETSEQLALALQQWGIPLADLAEPSECAN